MLSPLAAQDCRAAICSSSAAVYRLHGAGGETADLRHLSNESIKNYEFIFAGSNLHLPSL